MKTVILVLALIGAKANADGTTVTTMAPIDLAKPAANILSASLLIREIGISMLNVA